MVRILSLPRRPDRDRLAVAGDGSSDRHDGERRRADRRLPRAHPRRGRAALGRRRAGRRALRLPGPDGPEPSHRLRGRPRGGAGARARRRARGRCRGSGTRCSSCSNRGDFDVALNGIEATDEKRRVCALTRPYYVAPERLTVRRGDADARRAISPRSPDGASARCRPRSPSASCAAPAPRCAPTTAGRTTSTTTCGSAAPTRCCSTRRSASTTATSSRRSRPSPGSFGEVRYAIAVRARRRALRAALDAALDAISRADGTPARDLRALGPVECGDRGAARRHDAAARDRRRGVRSVARRGRPAAAVLRARARAATRAMLALFARGALLTLALSLAAMALAIPLGAMLALARKYGPPPLRWLAIGYIEVRARHAAPGAAPHALLRPARARDHARSVRRRRARARPQLRRGRGGELSRRARERAGRAARGGVVAAALDRAGAPAA